MPTAANLHSRVYPANLSYEMHQPFASTDTRRHLWLDPKVSATFSPRIARFVSTNTLPNTSFPHFSPEFRSPFAFRTNPLYRVGLDVFLRALLAGWMDQFNDTNAHEMHVCKAVASFNSTV